jgi:hypothetical protein
MLKRIPKSDISIRPFKAYKEWSFDDSSAEISLLEAQEGNYTSTISNIIITGSLSGSSYNKHSVFGQLRAQFYNDSVDNPFTRTGHKSPTYTSARLSKERFLSGSAKVISIPNVYVGEGIKKGSVVLTDNIDELVEILYFDDSFGNLQDDRDQINISRIDMGETRNIPFPQEQLINFTDLSEYVYSASFEEFPDVSIDIQNGTLNIVYNGVLQPTIQLISLDIESGVAIAEEISFLPEESQGIKIGNVFYNQGLIVLTRDSATRLQNQWKLDYKSTQTIYEHEYLLIANEDEFNVSQNPTAVVEVGRVDEYIRGTDGKIYKTTTVPGTKYIKKKSILEDGTILDYRIPSSVKANVSGGFEHYELSSSVDSTGSFLTPFITTIGLYDDNCDLVAVAKLPQPIKSEPDIPVNFIIRFDT